jgi:hypothetical protein
VSPATGEIEHPTGPTDVVLRLEEGGGFVPVEFMVTSAPIFTLYGDGTVIYRPPEFTPPPESGVAKDSPFRTLKLTPEQVDQLLTFALRDGALGLATKDQYENPMIADAATTIFTVRADGIERTISVYGLGMDDPSVPDVQIRRAFSLLAGRLKAFDESAPTEPETYEPTAYRGILLDVAGQVATDPIDWPWPEIAESDFTVRPEAGVTFPSRTMTPEEIAATGVTDAPGGFKTLMLRTGEGGLVGFAARPLLPDEDA